MQVVLGITDIDLFLYQHLQIACMIANYFNVILGTLWHLDVNFISLFFFFPSDTQDPSFLS